MKENGQTDRRGLILRLVILLALLATAVMIFLFSAEGSAESSATSAQVARFVMRLIGVDFDALSASEKTRVQFYVRKGAHFLEYTALGVFLHLFLSFFVKKRPLSFALSVALGAVYAATDEYHQFLVGSRSAQWKDVALDSAGVLFGTALALGILLLQKRKHRREKMKTEG